MFLLVHNFLNMDRIVTKWALMESSRYGLLIGAVFFVAESFMWTKLRGHKVGGKYIEPA